MATMNQQQSSEKVSIDPIVAKLSSDVPQQLKGIYDKAVLSGMRIMFDKGSHAMLEDQLAKEGPMATKIAEGIGALMYMLWEQSNKTIPPQLMIPVAVTLCLRAFEFLQDSNDPEATKKVLGDATSETIDRITRAFNVKSEDLPFAIQQVATGKLAANGSLPDQQNNPPVSATQVGGLMGGGNGA